LIRGSMLEKPWVVYFVMLMPLTACGDKATSASPADQAAVQVSTGRSLTDMGGGSGDEAPLAVPLESLDLKNTPIETKSVERRSAKEVEACMDERAANFKGPDGQPGVPSIEDLKSIIQACGA
jgi:hypothetical protein